MAIPNPSTAARSVFYCLHCTSCDIRFVSGYLCTSWAFLQTHTNCPADQPAPSATMAEPLPRGRLIVTSSRPQTTARHLWVQRLSKSSSGGSHTSVSGFSKKQVPLNCLAPTRSPFGGLQMCNRCGFPTFATAVLSWQLLCRKKLLGVSRPPYKGVLQMHPGRLPRVLYLCRWAAVQACSSSPCSASRAALSLNASNGEGLRLVTAPSSIMSRLFRISVLWVGGASAG